LSAQFGIGHISQASVGNFGLHGKQTYVDMVITPTAGTSLLVAEDAVDRYVMAKIERRTGNAWVMGLGRTALCFRRGEVYYPDRRWSWTAGRLWQNRFQQCVFYPDLNRAGGDDGTKL
jgi:hypothetical protein